MAGPFIFVTGGCLVIQALSHGAARLAGCARSWREYQCGTSRPIRIQGKPMKTSNLLALTCGVLCTGLLLADASATGLGYTTNRKIMAGSQCQPSTGSQTGDVYINPEGVRNISTQNRYVSCALVFDGDDDIDVDDSDDSTGPGGMEIEVGLDYSTVPSNQSPVTNCTLIRFDYDGTRTTAAFPAVQVQGGTTVTYTYLYNPAVLDGLSPFNPDTVSLNCRLPPQVRLNYVKTYEYEYTGGFYYVP